MRNRTKLFGAALTAMMLLSAAESPAAESPAAEARSFHPPDAVSVKTPIRHLVVIFQENVSFDHYFATYPHALNPDGEPRFDAAADTPTVNGLNDPLLYHNPNGANPQRLDRTEAVTCDQDHSYTNEQKAVNGGLMDKFVEFTTGRHCDATSSGRPSLVLDYYDGNTVTALWNYAQHYALSDNSFATVYGPSTPGALNLISGQTHGAVSTDPENDRYGAVSADANGVGTVINDPDPTFDDCSTVQYPTVSMVDSKRNVGDLLNARGVTWGWFEGGFRPTEVQDGKALCGARHDNIAGISVPDYIPHHQPFQYYRSTANPHHLAPESVAEVGRDGPANHQYDLEDFWAAVDAGELPSVSFLKAAAYQDGHAGYSNPLDEQTFLVETVNHLQKSRAWKDMAIVIAYDDSDGWYDHVMAPVVSQSSDPEHDALTGAGACGKTPEGGYADRCGYGPRLPLLIISPWSRVNFVDHSLTDQTSVLRFIEDNWDLGRIGDGSFDGMAGSIERMFDFGRGRRAGRLSLDPASGVAGRGR